MNIVKWVDDVAAVQESNTLQGRIQDLSRRGAPLRNDVTDGEVKHFKSEYVFTKKKVSSQGGCAPPAPSP